jgi:hypothetical protein
MIEINKKDEWLKIVNFYDELVNKDNWKQKPMISLMNKLRMQGFWEKYYPSTSHESLGISRKYNYEDRCESPMVYLQYQSNQDEFIIHYQEGQGNQIKEENCGNSVSETELQKIENWLEEK